MDFFDGGIENGGAGYNSVERFCALQEMYAARAKKNKERDAVVLQLRRLEKEIGVLEDHICELEAYDR